MVDNSSPKDYPELLKIVPQSNLDENSSLKKIFNLVREKKTVIDFGCATGYLAEILTQKECVVTGVEINEKAARIAQKYCREVIVADLDNISLSELFPTQTFDIAVFGDVLEHIRDPWRILRETRNLLTAQGYIVASIPNIAHGAIRLALLQGNFDYQEMGILDNTHLRFFTSKTVEELFEETGYIIETIERTKLSFLSNSHLLPTINLQSIDHHLIEQLQKEEDIDTLQFIVKAFPASLENQYALLKQKYLINIKQFNEIKKQLEQTQTELKQTQTYLQHIETELTLQITAMKNSKFWQLRETWFGIKRSLGLLVPSK